MKLFTIVALVALLPGTARADGPMSDLAARVVFAARRAHVARVAVLPLVSRPVAAGHDGEALADRLTELLVSDGRVKVVERSRLTEVMAERRLNAVSAPAEAASPRLAAAEAVVTGTFSRTGGRARASVRLIHAETGEILAAAEETFDWDAPAEASKAEEAWTLTVPAPEFLADVPPIVMDPVELRDAPNDGSKGESCDGAADRVDRIVAGIVELKARYWASELRKGFSPYAITRNPGSEITDPALKERFYGSMKAWFKKPFVPDLSRAEFERMRREDAKAAELQSRCGL